MTTKHIHCVNGWTDHIEVFFDKIIKKSISYIKRLYALYYLYLLFYFVTKEATFIATANGAKTDAFCVNLIIRLSCSSSCYTFIYRLGMKRERASRLTNERKKYWNQKLLNGREKINIYAELWMKCMDGWIDEWTDRLKDKF